MRFEIMVFDGVDELDAVGPYEVLARAAREAGWSVRLVVLPGRPLEVLGHHGLALRAHGVLSSDPDVLVVTGGGWVDRSAAGIRAEVAQGDIVRAVSERAGQGVLAAVCTGAMALAAAGLLEGRRASTHHGASADLAAAGAVPVEARVVDDGDIVTAGGVTSGLDLGLWLVERFAGADAAARVAAGLEHNRREAAWAAPQAPPTSPAS
jgi:transcriptional regulator GlxA family with amidase domain